MAKKRQTVSLFQHSNLNFWLHFFYFYIAKQQSTVVLEWKEARFKDITLRNILQQSIITVEPKWKKAWFIHITLRNIFCNGVFHQLWHDVQKRQDKGNTS